MTQHLAQPAPPRPPIRPPTDSRRLLWVLVGVMVAVIVLLTVAVVAGGLAASRALDRVGEKGDEALEQAQASEAARKGAFEKELVEAIAEDPRLEGWDTEEAFSRWDGEEFDEFRELVESYVSGEGHVSTHKASHIGTALMTTPDLADIQRDILENIHSREGLDRWLEAYLLGSDDLDQLRSASLRGLATRFYDLMKSYWKQDDVYWFVTQDFVATLMSGRAIAEAEAGLTAEAFDTCLAIHEIAQSSAEGPYLYDQRERVDIEKEADRALQSVLDRVDEWAEWQDEFCSLAGRREDHARLAEVVMREAGLLPVWSAGLVTEEVPIDRRVASWFAGVATDDIEEAAVELVNLMDEPYPQIEQKLEALLERCDSWTHYLVDMGADVYERHLRGAVMADVIPAVFVLKAYKQEHGSYPESLEELVPDYIENVPVDRITGRPVLYWRFDDGFFITAPRDPDDDTCPLLWQARR